MSVLNFIIPLIAFIIFANPATFTLVRGFAGEWVANNAGRASTAGLFLHGLIFVCLVGLIMTFTTSKKSKYSPGPSFTTRDDANTVNTKKFQENRILYSVTP